MNHLTFLGREGTGPLTLHLTGRRAKLPTESVPAEWKEEWYAGIAVRRRRRMAMNDFDTTDEEETDTTQYLFTCSIQGIVDIF